MSGPYRKPALSFAQQIAQLRQRGLVIADEARAEEHLQQIGYYRLSGYWLPFKQADDSLQGTFDDAVRLYEFDRRLRLLILDAIERVEVQLRTALAYGLGKRFGAFAHEHPGNFRTDFGDAYLRVTHADWLLRLREETERSHEQFVIAYRQKYDDYQRLPVWMATEIMSFGSLSRLYGALLPDQQRAIAQPWGLHFSVLHNWLHVLSTVRNTAAHHARLWNRDLSIQPKLPHGIPAFADTVVPNRRRSYVVVLMLRHLTRPARLADDWAREAIALLHTWDGQPRWQSAMGLPATWAQMDLWQAGRP